MILLKKKLISIVGVVLIFLLIFAAAFLFLREEEKTLPIKYEQEVFESASAYDVPPELVFSIIYAESTFRDQVVSKHGAMGLMQLMPETYEELAGKLGIDTATASPFDPQVNIKCGTYYLHELYQMFGRWELVIIAYNAGLGNVRTWLADSRYADGQGGLAVVPYSETATYLRRVQSAMPTYRDMIQKQTTD